MDASSEEKVCPERRGRQGRGEEEEGWGGDVWGARVLDCGVQERESTWLDVNF